MCPNSRLRVLVQNAPENIFLSWHTKCPRFWPTYDNIPQTSTHFRHKLNQVWIYSVKSCANHVESGKIQKISLRVIFSLSWIFLIFPCYNFFWRDTYCSFLCKKGIIVFTIFLKRHCAIGFCILLIFLKGT